MASPFVARRETSPFCSGFLRLEFARTTALALAIVEMVKFPILRVLLQPLMAALGPKLQHWAKTLIEVRPRVWTELYIEIIYLYLSIYLSIYLYLAIYIYNYNYIYPNDKQSTVCACTSVTACMILSCDGITVYLRRLLTCDSPPFQVQATAAAAPVMMLRRRSGRLPATRLRYKSTTTNGTSVQATSRTTRKATPITKDRDKDKDTSTDTAPRPRPPRPRVPPRPRGRRTPSAKWCTGSCADLVCYLAPHR